MSFDIIKYSALQECVVVYNTFTGACASLSTVVPCLTPNNAHCVHCWRAAESDVIMHCSCSNSICLFCGNQTGVCCAWTVPTGTVKARFEIWGPGATSGTVNCCGAATWGATGAYMAFTIPVTAGCVYTLCAAPSNDFCSYCCGCDIYSTACCNGSQYCSFVTGYGVNNAIVPGGCTSYVQNMCARLCRIGQLNPTVCYFTNECVYAANPICGQRICAATYSLCSIGCGTYSILPAADWNLWPRTPCITVGLCQYTPVFRLPSFHNGHFVTTSMYGSFNHIPTYPLNWNCQCSCTNFGCNTEINFTSETCINPCGQSQNSICCCYPIPGLGGGPMKAEAGGINMYGDRGRMGMVKVTWTCCNSDSTCAN